LRSALLRSDTLADFEIIEIIEIIKIIKIIKSFNLPDWQLLM